MVIEIGFVFFVLRLVFFVSGNSTAIEVSQSAHSVSRAKDFTRKGSKYAKKNELKRPETQYEIVIEIGFVFFVLRFVFFVSGNSSAIEVSPSAQRSFSEPGASLKQIHNFEPKLITREILDHTLFPRHACMLRCRL